MGNMGDESLPQFLTQKHQPFLLSCCCCKSVNILTVLYHPLPSSPSLCPGVCPGSVGGGVGDQGAGDWRLSLTAEVTSHWDRGRGPLPLCHCGQPPSHSFCTYTVLQSCHSAVLELSFAFHKTGLLI